MPFLVLLFLPLLSLATDLRFTPYADIAPHIELARYRSAVHLLETKNGRCTATEISSEGHLITARHCLQICLIQSGYFRVHRELGIDYFDTDPNRQIPAKCEVALDGTKETVEIVASSPGLITAMDERSFRSQNSELYKKFAADGYTEQGDFALIKRKKAGACVSLSHDGFSAGNPVRSLGFPSETTRPDGFNSDGEQLYYTSGEIFGSIRENPCVQELGSDPRAAEQEKIYDHPGAFVSSLDAIHGSSGSSVINERGDVIGILTNMYIHPTKDPAKAPMMRYCRGGAKALGIESLKRFAPVLAELKCD